MKSKLKFISAILTLCLAFSLSVGVITPIVSYAADDTVYIGSTDEFVEFAKSCALDSWSKGKRFALSADISLEGVSFDPVPFFAGSFDGNGHKISGLSIDGAHAPAGLFARLAEGGIIENLIVEGSISPSGEKCFVGGIVGDNRGTLRKCSFFGSVIGKGDVGGIVGINRLSGSIEDSAAEGEIIGDSRTGGIAGTNLGLISSSDNSARINTVSITPGISLEELNAALTIDITKLPTINNIARTDSGGIAGYSCGMILGCKNKGEVGYPHIGYNAGGIAGRSSGHLSGNENYASVYGRGDVGGIVGQIEPFISYDLSEDLLLGLKTEMDNLHALIGDVADSIDESSESISSRLDKIIGLIGSASDSIDSISGGITDWGDGVIGEVNRLGAVLAETLDRISAVTNQLPSLTEALSGSLSSLEKCLTEMEDVSEIGREALADLDLSLEDMRSAIDLLGRGAESIESGIVALKNSIKTDDSEGVKNALVEIGNGMNEVASAIGSMSSTADKVSEIMSGISSGSDVLSSFSELAGAFGEMSSSLSGLANGMTKVSDAVSFISQHVTTDVDMALSGIEKIGDGLSLMVDAAEAIEGSVAHIRDSIKHISDASVELDEAMVYFRDAVSNLEKAADLTTEILVDVDSLVDYLASVDPIQIPTVDESVTIKADELFTTISSLESNLGRLNSDVKGASGDVADLVRQINDCFSNMMNTLVSAIYGFNDIGSSFESGVDPEDVDSVTNGRIFDCINYGSIYGDKNVGGIGGIMSLEYSVDPEDDISEEITITQKRQYKLKAVIHACENLGEVTAKRDCVGGIVGKADMGIVYESESYSRVTSESGSFVGGIAGISAADIISCYTKSLLKGKKYVGGILGSGVNEDYSGDSSLVSGCISIVRIESFSQYGGAVCGTEAGEFKDNRFISADIQGIDRVSYEGKAEPVSYDELMKQRNLPTRLYSFTLTFIADGEVLASHSFEYGASFDKSVFPKIPEKKGYYSYWDTDELEDLTFDTVVSVVYRPFVSSVGSDASRDDGRDIFIVEGSFKEGEKITLTKGSLNTDGLKIESGLFKVGELSESWILNIPDDGESNVIRFLPNSKDIDIYIKQEGVWTKIDAEKIGSYSVFSLDSERIELAIVSYSANILTIVLFSLLGLMILTAIIIIPIIIKRKRKQSLDFNDDGDEYDDYNQFNEFEE